MATADPEPIAPPPAPVFEHPPQIPIVPPPITLPKFELPEEDGIPMETPWHRYAMYLLIDVVACLMRGRTDYYVGGNMFIYYGAQQAKTWSYRGPDFFYVADVDGSYERRTWITWEEEGRFPDVIIELTSPSTRAEDHGNKKKIYERTFRSSDYYCYDPDGRLLEGWHLSDRRYRDLKPNERGWLWCDTLGLWLGTWEGVYLERRQVWLRWYDKDGQLLPTWTELERQHAEAERRRADEEQRRADEEQRRADTAEAKLARVQTWLSQQGIVPPNGGPNP